MTKYKVLKECISPLGTYHAPGDELTADLPNSFVERGFVEEIKEGRWTPEKDGHYWMIDTNHQVEELHRNIEYDEQMVQAGNCFKSRETAELVAEATKLMYEYLHNGEPVFNDFENLRRSIEEAHGAVLKDDRNE